MTLEILKIALGFAMPPTVFLGLLCLFDWASNRELENLERRAESIGRGDR